MNRQPRLCTSGCGRPVRKRRGARFCSPCVTRMAKLTCSTCGSAFQPDMMATKTRCRPCQRERLHSDRVAKTYGMTGGQYAELLAYQGGVCWGCRRKPVSKRLAVDHDHKTGRTRGLLCRSCNRDVLGHLRDDVDALLRLVDYLRLPPAQRLWGEDTPVAPEQG